MDQFEHLVEAVIKAAFAEPAVVLVPSEHQKDLAGSIERKLFGERCIAYEVRSGIAHARMADAAEGASDV